MGIISFLFNNKKNESAIINEAITKPIQEDKTIDIDFPKDEIVGFSEDVIDTSSLENELKLKHNLEILINRAKKNNRIEKFVIIREDDVFPYNFEWLPCSDVTTLEYESTNLSYILRKRIAESKLKNVKIGDMVLPHTRDEIDLELSKIDKTLGNVYMPSHFRSTKHFTINTPLGVTGDYNAVKTGRNFIIIDAMDNFLNSGYAYSVGYRDAYLDVTHEPLKISENAIILIDIDKFDDIIKDESIASELKTRKVIKFKGDEILAIDMVLSELSILPSRIGMKYAIYNEEVRNILDHSIESLSRKNNLSLNKSHGGTLSPEGGHFSNYFDEKNHDRRKYFSDLAKFISNVCNVDFEFTFMIRVDEHNINVLIDTVGTEKVLSAIDEYNKKVLEEFNKKKKKYIEERKNITSDIHDLFISTIGLIDEYYKGTERIKDNFELEGYIQKFLQSKSLEEQIESAKTIQSMIKKNKKNEEITENLNKLL